MNRVRYTDEELGTIGFDILSKTLRNRLGMTQGAFSRVLGVKQGTLSAWERAHREPALIHKRFVSLLLWLDERGHGIPHHLFYDVEDSSEEELLLLDNEANDRF